ncbi:amidase [Oceanobacillus massiliensis]|uniref:amidase n=1 Tax=Oceanobacillus massiliensis TaxID=1465765 RepID=UPI00028906CC|nr:amidase [Oceanobacillus massiliensis]
MKDLYHAYVNKDLTVDPSGHSLLDGLTFSVKDVIAIKGHTNGAGNPDWLASHDEAGRHAPVIERLLQHGARLHGVTHTDEIMYSLNGENYHYGTPVNPKAPDRIPGGSSSGSAVAVSGGSVDFALGTDTGGSVRIPSAYCGIFGFRPTHGAMSMEGVIPLAQSFDTIGWMARSPAIMRKVGNALLDEADQNDAGKTEFIFLKQAWEFLDEDTSNVLSAFTPIFEKLGSKSIASASLSDWANAFRYIQGIEIWQEHGKWIRQTRPAFGPDIAARFEWASTLNKDGAEKEFELRKELWKTLAEELGNNGVFVIPTTPGTAPKLNLASKELEERRNKTMQLTCIAGLAGLPQVTIPAAEIDGMPVGLSIIANRNQDRRLLMLVEKIFETIAAKK